MTDSPFLRALPAVIALFVLLWSAADIAVSAVFSSNISHVSGAWMVLARDLAEGTLYRPLFDPTSGYGGTRFMPLFFSLHAALIGLGAPVTGSGIALSLISGLALFVAVVAFLRIRRTSTLTTLLAVAALASFLRIREGFTSVRGDLLPVAFALSGACAFLRARCAGGGADAGGAGNPKRYLLLAVAGFLFALAFLTKITSLFALAAAVTTALLAAVLVPPVRRSALREALVSAGAFVLTAAVGLGLTQVLSGGSFLETFHMSASGGASSLAPWTMIRGGLGGLKWQWESNQVSFRVVLVLAFALAAWKVWRLRSNVAEGSVFEPLFFLFSLAGTVIILSSPGAAANHLVDVMVAGILLLAVGLEDAAATVAGPRFASRAAPLVLTLVALLSMRTNVPALLDREDRRPEDEALAAAIASDELVLAENPAVLIRAGRGVRVLDTFMLRVIRERDTEVSGLFLDEIRTRAYDALLLFEPQDEAGRLYLERMHFGPGFRDALADSYEMHEMIGSTAIYRPRPLAYE